MEHSGDIYGNYNEGNPNQIHLDDDENIYANQETSRAQMSTQRKRGNRELPGAGTIEVKCCGVSVVSLGLLCVLLLAVIIWMVTKHTAETDQLQRNMDLLHSNLIKERDLFEERNTNLTKERDQLQLTNSNLTKERDLFQERNTNLTKERNQLEITKGQVSQENHQLRDINRNLTAEKNDLMDKNRKLIAEKEKLLNAIQIPQGWRHFGNSFYYISNDQTTWSDGKQYCMDLGGHLVIIDSEEEQVFMAGIQKRGWIGLTDVEGTWKWLDGKLLETGYWNEGEPNNLNGNEHCVEILHRATSLKNWNDNICTARYSYFCERPI